MCSSEVTLLEQLFPDSNDKAESASGYLNTKEVCQG